MKELAVDFLFFVSVIIVTYYFIEGFDVTDEFDSGQRGKWSRFSHSVGSLIVLAALILFKVRSGY